LRRVTHFGRPLQNQADSGEKPGERTVVASRQPCRQVGGLNRAVERRELDVTDLRWNQDATAICGIRFAEDRPACDRGVRPEHDDTAGQPQLTLDFEPPVLARIELRIPPDRPAPSL
jgi:hypothetical protein